MSAPRNVILAAGALLLGACSSGTPTGKGNQPPGGTQLMNPDMKVSAGLATLIRKDLPNDYSGTPHSTELIVDNQSPTSTRIYINMGDGIAAYDIGADGQLDQAFYAHADTPPAAIRCVTIALHRATHRVFCAASDVSMVGAVDTVTGALILPANYSPYASLGGARGLFVQGDVLYVAAFDRGLLRAPILADGTLGPYTTVLADTALHIDGDGDGTRLVVTTRSELIVLDQEKETARIPLTGAPLGVRLRDTRAVVSLGSYGAAVIDLKTKATTTVTPACVVLSGDISGNALALGCITGAYLYDLSSATPYLAGFEPSAFGDLDVQFYTGQTGQSSPPANALPPLAVLDWRIFALFNTDLSGHIVKLVTPPGFAVHPGADLKFAVTNQGDVGLDLYSDYPAFAGQHIGPNSDLWLTVSPTPGDLLWAAIGTDEDPETDEANHVAVAGSSHIPMVGDAFPIPLTNRAVYFIQPDCAIQWPVLEDLEYIITHNGLPDGHVPIVLLTPSNDSEFPLLLSILQQLSPHAEMHLLSEYFPGQASGDVFNTLFNAVSVIGGADVTVDTFLDDTGHVQEMSRVYQGIYRSAMTVTP